MSMNTPIKSIIIDDDPFIHDLLGDKLEQHLPEIRVAGRAFSGSEGLAAIRAWRPELVFLDVEMQDMTGFEMLAQVPEINFQVIFITSYSHYAIKAIRFNALDYIIKPIDLDELKQAIGRFKSRKAQAATTQIQQALQNLKTEDPGKQVLILNLQEGQLRLPIKNIVRLEGERNYSLIYLKNRPKKLASKTLADFEEILQDKGFFRSHRSHLVNFLHIDRYPDKTRIIMSDGLELPVSRRKKEAFFTWYHEMKDAEE